MGACKSKAVKINMPQEPTKTVIEMPQEPTKTVVEMPQEPAKSVDHTQYIYKEQEEKKQKKIKSKYLNAAGKPDIKSYIKKEIKTRHQDLYQKCYDYYIDQFVTNSDKIVDQFVDGVAGETDTVYVRFNFDLLPSGTESRKVVMQLKELCSDQAFLKQIYQIYGRKIIIFYSSGNYGLFTKLGEEYCEDEYEYETEYTDENSAKE